VIEALQEEVPVWLTASQGAVERMRLFAALVRKWTPAINLVSKASVPDLWSRHMLDSAQLLALAPALPHRWVDLGSGGGFPGIVIAILTEGHSEVVLVESDARKATFLGQAVRELGLNARVVTSRIEALADQRGDVVSARALGSLTALCGYAHRHLAPGGVALFPKGARADLELTEAAKTWAFSVQQHPSRTETGASILAVRDIRHA